MDIAGKEIANQILEDSNGNGIPDIVEEPCSDESKKKWIAAGSFIIGGVLVFVVKYLLTLF